jgi:hypothetical protein
MFEFLIPVSIFGFGGYFVYKLCELYGMRSERRQLLIALRLRICLNTSSVCQLE